MLQKNNRTYDLMITERKIPKNAVIPMKLLLRNALKYSSFWRFFSRN
jgi:hypothetical protein